MNIFFLSRDTAECARFHNDKHCVKMILDSAQLLSTAHRILDGTPEEGLSKTGRRAKRHRLSDDRDSVLYAVTHVNHPSAVWARATNSNYVWLNGLLMDLCEEYTHRYHRVHKVESSGLLRLLRFSPTNVRVGDYSDPPATMPDKYKVEGDIIKSYHNYYIGDKRHLARWTNRCVPRWFAEGVMLLNKDDVMLY